VIGYFDYTVWLTYASLISAISGIFCCFHGGGHPYLGALCLLISGLCDAFDGKVARTKKDRTGTQKKYGIQIDSLADLVAFGVLPACIGAAMYRVAGMFDADTAVGMLSKVPYVLIVIVFALYVLAALIRLAYYNVEEEENQSQGKTQRVVYTGLPVTSASIIFPSYLLLNHLLKADITIGYYGLMFLVAAAFVGRFSVKKPSFKAILVLVGIGLLEFLLFLLMGSGWQNGL